MKKKILFLIPNLKPGGAERVLVNLANNLDPARYAVTVQTVFDVGVHRKALAPHVRYVPGMKYQFRGNTHILKLFPPEMLYKHFVRETYDIVISGCQDPVAKKVCWIHTEMMTPKAAALSHRSLAEAKVCYGRFDRIIAVSEQVRKQFLSNVGTAVPVTVLYNTNETEQIQQKATEEPDNPAFLANAPRVCAIGRVNSVKGFDRLLKAHKRLLDEGIRHHVYILGTGEDQAKLTLAAQNCGVGDTFTLLGFCANPYQYLSRSDLFVCSSRREGFSTAVTESLIVGTPVVSTNCSGAKELLGENDEYGLVVENSEEGIYQGMRKMLSDPALLAHYKEKAKERGSFFSRTETVRAVEEMLDNL